MKNINANALVAFSIGQDTAKGQTLREDIELASKLYGTITLLAGDSLQRHTKMITELSSIQESYQRSLKEGDEWLVEVRNICSELNIKCNILRWDELITRKDFEAHHLRIDEMYKQGAFRKAARNTVGKFIRRYQDKGIIPQEKAKEAFDICLRYVKEECAVFLMLGGQYTHLQYHFPLGTAIEHVCNKAGIKTVEAAKVHKQLSKPAAPVHQGAFFRVSSPIASPASSPEHGYSPPSSPDEESAKMFYEMIRTQVDFFMKRSLKPDLKQAVVEQLDLYLRSQLENEVNGPCYN